MVVAGAGQWSMSVPRVAESRWRCCTCVLYGLGTRLVTLRRSTLQRLANGITLARSQLDNCIEMIFCRCLLLACRSKGCKHQVLIVSAGACGSGRGR